jgi:hypothetical protein
MMKSKSLILTAGLVVAALCAATSVQASIVKYTIGNGGLETFNVKMDGQAMNNILAGGISITQTPSGNNASVPQYYVSVCTDLEASLYLGSTYKYNTPPNAFSGQIGIDPIWGAVNTPAYLGGSAADALNAAKAIQNAAYIFNTFGNLTANHTGMSGTLSQLAAVQLAVWAVLYDTGSNGKVVMNADSRFQLTGGADGTAITDVTTYINAINASANSGNFGYTGYLLFPNGAPNDIQGNRDGQPPQELMIDAASFTPVPEPSTVVAGLLLLLPFGASTLKLLRHRRA